MFKECRQAEEPKQLAHEASRLQYSAVICSGALLFSSRVLCPSLITLCSHKSGLCAVELYHAPHFWYPLFYTSPMASSALQHWTASVRRTAATEKLVEKIVVKHDSWPIQPDILNPPLLRLTSRKPLWLDLQPVDIKSRWRHNWKSARVINSHLVCDPHNPATGFRPPSATVLSAELFSQGTGTLQCLQKEMATYRSVSLWRDPDDVPHCWILSPDKTESRLISAALCRWRRCFVADQLWFTTCILEEEFCQCCENWPVTVWEC